MNSNTEHLTMSRVSCSYDFFIKCAISKKRKKEKRKERKKEASIPFIRFTLYNKSFYLLFHDSWSNTVYTILKLHTAQGRYDEDEE